VGEFDPAQARTLDRGEMTHSRPRLILATRNHANVVKKNADDELFQLRARFRRSSHFDRVDVAGDARLAPVEHFLLGELATIVPPPPLVDERALTALAEEIGLMLAEEVVAAPMDIDLCLILGAGWPFHLGGITPYLDREGISERLLGRRFLPPGLASVPISAGF
jgi:hypothetical protein